MLAADFFHNPPTHRSAADRAHRLTAAP
jgi:hypothetical protein